jgi:hypothetical protein
MTAEATAPRNSLLARATKIIEIEEAILADLVAKKEPEEEQAFRIARRAEWLAIELMQKIAA